MKVVKSLEENLNNLQAQDPEIARLIFREFRRQRDNVELIASENFTYRGAMEVAGSILTNKYAEGYPGKRFYGGCEEVDKIEKLAIKRACKLFNCKYANVQPHSGSSANLAAYHALCDPNDTIMGLSLFNGGHLTHGTKMNFSGTYFNSVSYTLDPKTERLNYEMIYDLAKKHKPKVIIAGYSAYPRKISFKNFREICNKVGAYLMVDMAHIAGLVAAGEHPSPLPYADVVTSTTHKTLRGPRSGIILTNKKDIAEKIDKAVFPGTQGGPLLHIIAAKALSFKMADTKEFKKYAHQVVLNSKAMAKGLKNGGLRLITGGTDNHLCLADVTVANTTGKEVEEACSKAKITINKNTIPGEKLSPFVASGIRVGTPAVTSRDFNEGDCYTIGKHIAKIAFNPHSKSVREDAKHSAELILNSHPLY